MENPVHILIVEDEPLVRECLLAALDGNYRVSSACTAGEALAILRTSHIDAALIDFSLPDGSGDEIAACAAKEGVAVITMSGYPADMLEPAGTQHPHLEKPFKLDLLHSTLKNALQGSVQNANGR